MADLRFYAGEDFSIDDLSGSGLGFYGDGGFAFTVSVSSWQGRTFITNSNCTTQGAEVDNIKYLNLGSGIIGQTGSGVGLTVIPNYLATLNIRFTHSSAVQVQNPEVRIYDRSNVNNPASGVTCAVAEIIHPSITQTNNGSGDTTWSFLTGSSVTLSLAPSPGVSGHYAGNGSNSTRADTVHDWFLAISASPDSIGSKTQFGLYMSLEYL